jgi:pyridoxal phosphate enzyme (YggS family)
LSQLATRYKEVQERISAAALSSGRQASDVDLIVITKTHPTLVVAELADLGHRSFGENRDQEAKPKAFELESLRPDCSFDWHFVGQLQSNKVKSAMSYAKTIHSLDRPSLLKEIAKQLAAGDVQIDCYIELNLTEDLNRGGLDPSVIKQFADSALTVPGLNLLGVMAVAGLDVDPRVDFEKVIRISRELREIAPDAMALSIGMSADYEVAIELGATHVRIGSAITGPRGNN